MPEMWKWSSDRSHEVEWVRRGVRDGLRWAGTEMLCCQRWTLWDFENGLVKRCPDCYDEVLKQVSNTRCQSCYGTGFEGGYGKPFRTWASISENQAQAEDEKHELQGVRQPGQVSIKLPVDHIFHNGDVFAEIRAQENKVVTQLGRLWVIDTPVAHQTTQGWVSDDNDDDSRTTILEDIMTSQAGTVKLLLPTDVLYVNAQKLFGAPVKPYVTPSANQEAMNGQWSL
jgi:hypothetical protein